VAFSTVRSGRATLRIALNVLTCGSVMATIKDLDATASCRPRLFALLFAPTPPTAIISYSQEARTRSLAG
jgi:hypothetical protein